MWENGYMAGCGPGAEIGGMIMMLVFWTLTIAGIVIFLLGSKGAS